MSTTQRALVTSVAVVALSAMSAVGGAAAGQQPPASVGTTPSVGVVTRAPRVPDGLQNTTKHTSRPRVRVGGRTYPAANPSLALLPTGSPVDGSYWRTRWAAAGKRRAATRAALHRKVPTPVSYDEREPVGTIGDNDSQANAERIGDFGSDRAFQGVKVSGRLSAPRIGIRTVPTAEDQGAIPLATATGIGPTRQSVTVASRIGDGPHGSKRDGHGDYDFFKVHGTRGDTLAADTLGSKLDTILVLYDASGKILAVNDDVGDDEGDGKDTSSEIDYDVTTTADYYVMVSGFSDFSPTPASPFRSGSGRGAGDEGTYRLHLTSAPVDKDYYGVHLRSGDVLGGSLTGGASTVTVRRTDGRAMIGSSQDESANYPAQSPLPGGGSSFSYVAQRTGWYAVSATDGAGSYRLLLEVYRPGSSRAAAGAVQTIFLDFDGARLNTNVFGLPAGTGGVRTLSPMSSFLHRWGLTNKDNAAVIRATVDGVKENIRDTLRAKGLNGDVRVRVLNSRNHPDPFGQPNVSRVVIGGTQAQTGVDTIGIAQSIDPGNFAHEETAMVLLDYLSDSTQPGSFNAFLRPSSNRIAFIGRALSNVVSHETGHFIGSLHTDPGDARANLMDAGGGDLGQMYGVGPDRIGGTADDVDVNFGEDAYDGDEGFTGLEDTLNNSAWAFLPGTAR